MAKSITAVRESEPRVCNLRLFDCIAKFIVFVTSNFKQTKKRSKVCLIKNKKKNYTLIYTLVENFLIVLFFDRQARSTIVAFLSEKIKLKFFFFLLKVLVKIYS